MCGLNESGYSDKNTVMEEVEGRIIPVPNDSDSFINEIMKHPDAHVLIDMLIGEKDAVSFIREAKRRLPQCRPVFIVKCEYVSFRMERELYGAGASAVIAKDWSPDTVLSLLREYFGVSGGASSVRDNAPGEPVVDPVELEIMVTDIMHKVGVPAHIKGYQYLRCAIVKAVMEPEIINAVTRELYPGVAACFLTTPSLTTPFAAAFLTSSVSAALVPGTKLSNMNTSNIPLASSRSSSLLQVQATPVACQRECRM